VGDREEEGRESRDRKKTNKERRGRSAPPPPPRGKSSVRARAFGARLWRRPPQNARSGASFGLKTRAGQDRALIRALTASLASLVRGRRGGAREKEAARAHLGRGEDEEPPEAAGVWCAYAGVWGC
jgi:hypothetical protein